MPLSPQRILLLLLTSPLIVTADISAPTTTISGKNAKLRFTSPIQSFTIFEKSALSSLDYASPRKKFLPRFRAGLVAERRAREALLEEQRRGILDFDDGQMESGDGAGWAEASAAADERKKKAMEGRVEAAFDAAVKEYDERVAAAKKKVSSVSSSSGKYQFVGVVNNGTRNAVNNSVTWFARKKPNNSKWNVRLVHVNRDAVLRDLFVRGKVDVYGKYVNEGLDNAAFEAADKSGESIDERFAMKPCVMAQYSIKERSWKTLWNFSPKRMLTLPSGSFWRERRIDPGLYTDGNTVYEAVYRYRDGKNGMKPVTKLSNFLSSPALGNEEKMRIVERLKGGDSPDVVVEK